MATSGRGTGIVGYNVQTAVDTKHHLIVAHEVTNVGHDRTQLADMAGAGEGRHRPADHGAWPTAATSRARRSCAAPTTGIVPLVPKPLTSNNKAAGRFDKSDFVYIAADDTYRCPGGERCHPPHDGGRERHDAAQVLVIGLSGDVR